MNKKLIAILCGLLMPISLAFADVASDVADHNVSNADALSNAVSAGMTEDEATRALIDSLIAAGVDTADAIAAASLAGGTNKEVDASVKRLAGETGVSNSRLFSNAVKAYARLRNNNLIINGVPGSGQEVEDGSYGT